MRWIERFDLFLLDFDGLLVDTEKIHFQAYQTLCLRYQYDLTWDFKKYISIAHRGSESLRFALHPHLQEKKGQWESLYREKKAIYLQLLKENSLQLMPGIEEFLNELRRARVKRCVVTHSPREQIACIKNALPLLQTIPVWITREDYEMAKPAPDGYLKALELLYDEGDRVIGFEDSLRGIQALQAAGVDPILICDPSHPQLQEHSLGSIRHFGSIQQIPRSFKP